MRPYFSAGHVRLAGLGHQEGALEVHVHHGVPVVLGHLEDQVVADDAGVVDEHDRRPELVGDPGDAGLDLRGIRDVDAHADGAGHRRRGSPAATASQAASSRSSTPTANPSRPSRWAVAAPMPRAAPVTMATRWVDMRTPRVRGGAAATSGAAFRPYRPGRRTPRPVSSCIFMTSPREGRLHPLRRARRVVRGPAPSLVLTTHGRQPVEIWPGTPYPLGATYDGSGVNFALFSEVAERVELCLIDDDGAETRVDLPEVDGFVWHALPARPAARPALRLPRARPLRPRAAATAATRASCCSTPTPRRSRARSTATRRCSPTASRTPKKRNTDDNLGHTMLLGRHQPVLRLGPRPPAAARVPRDGDLRGPRQGPDDDPPRACPRRSAAPTPGSPTRR